MKVIDAMIKVSRGEKVSFEILNNDNHIYHSTNGSFLYDETSKQEVYWYIDEDWLNREIKLIEEDKKIERITDKAFLNSPFGELVGGKFNEIIDVLNEMREDK